MQKFTFRIFLFLCVLGMVSATSFAQVLLAPGDAYTQNFNGMGTTLNLPTAWRMDVNTVPRTVGNYTTAVSTVMYLGGANMASNNANGGTYNFGDGATVNGGSDRAVGGLNTSNSPTTVNLYVGLQNTSASTITNFVIAYDIEKYRNGKNNDGTSVDLYYSLNPAGPWTLAPAFTQTYAADADNDGYASAPGSSRSVPSTVLAVSLNPDATLYLAWSISVSANAVGADASNSMALGIDNVRITAGPAAAPPPAYYFRSITSGDWSDRNTWEYSTTGADGTWNPPPAPHSPDYNDRTITIQSPNIVTVAADVTTDETIVNTDGTLSIASGIKLSVHDGTYGDGFDLRVNGTVNGAGNLTFKSTSSGTASLAPVTGSITATSTIERFILGKRAWRFLAAPISGSQTIHAAWQEGAASASSNPNPGYGTAITGSSSEEGFDVDVNNGVSLKVYSKSSSNILQQDWVGISSTLIPITNYQGYMLFVRGSRANSLTTATYSDATLRITGLLNTGSQSTSIDATGWTVVGNPYPAPINLNNLAKGNRSENLADNYYVWDPKMTGSYGVGGYVNINWNGGGYDITPESGSVVSLVSQYIQSGEAFFAKQATSGTAGTIVIEEADKNLSGSDNVFRVSSIAQKIRTNLYSINTNGSTVLLDGILNSYSNLFNNAIDKSDAVKISNVTENLGSVRDGQTLIVERRKEIGDDINLKMWQMQQHDYQFEIITENIAQSGLTAYLQDNYLKTSTPLNMSGTTNVKFTITADPASAATNRFVISFAKPIIAVAGNPAMSVFPNPVTNGIINLQMNNMSQGIYNVRVFNNVGQVVITKQINHAAGSSTEAIQLGKGAKGMYQLEVVKPDNSKFNSKVIAN